MTFEIGEEPNMLFASMGYLSILPEPYCFLKSCPYWLLYYSPAVADVSSLYGWRKDGCLNPLELSPKVQSAVDYYTRGYNRGEKDKYDARKRAKK